MSVTAEGPKEPPPPPDPQRILGERSLGPRTGSGPTEPPQGPDEPPGGDDGPPGGGGFDSSPGDEDPGRRYRRLRIAAVLLAALALGLGAATAVLAMEGSKQKLITQSTTETKTLKPTTSTTTTEVLTTVVTTVVETNETVTETETESETVTEKIPAPGGGGDEGKSDG